MISDSPLLQMLHVAFSAVVTSLTVYLLCLYLCIFLDDGSRARCSVYCEIGVILLLLTWREDSNVVGAGGRRNDDVEEK